MTHIRAIVGVAVLAAASGAGGGERGRFSSELPDELQYSDAGFFSDQAGKLAEQLTTGLPTERLNAAQELWRGHGRRHASDVLKFVAGPPPGGNDFRAFQREVEASFQPEAILKELKDGDYDWGTWLAFLRPHKDLVPALLANLKDRKDYELAATMLALGNSGDRRAFDPLLAIAKGKDERSSGDAAFALGYLGDPKAEPVLIDLLGREGWPQLRACEALAVVGTPKALPALEKAAALGFTGVLNVSGMALDAIVRIERRHLPKDPTRWLEGPTPEPAHTLRGHGDRVRAIAFSPDGKTLASVGNDRAVRLWDVATGKPTAAFDGPGDETTEVAFAGPGLLAVAGWRDGSVHLLDARTGRESRTIAVDKNAVDSLAVSADGKRLAASKSTGNDQSSVVVFDIATGQAAATLPDVGYVLAFSLDGKLLATTGGAKSSDVQLWDLATQKVIQTLHNQTETAGTACFNPDGKQLVTARVWTVRVWDVKTGKQTAKFRGDSDVSSVSFSADGRRVAVGERELVRVWNVAGKSVDAVFPARGPVAYSPDGKTLATTAPDGIGLLLWNVGRK